MNYLYLVLNGEFITKARLNEFAFLNLKEDSNLSKISGLLQIYYLLEAVKV